MQLLLKYTNPAASTEIVWNIYNCLQEREITFFLLLWPLAVLASKIKYISHSIRWLGRKTCCDEEKRIKGALIKIIYERK